MTLYLYRGLWLGMAAGQGIPPQTYQKYFNLKHARGHAIVLSDRLGSSRQDEAYLKEIFIIQ
ncbi:hypothetical protein ACS0TY_034063 [Phlomoides rotata]